MNVNAYIDSPAGEFEKKIAKLYIFLLTLNMIGPLTFTQTFFHAAAAKTDFVLHVIGIYLILRRNHWNIRFTDSSESRLLKFFAGVVLLLNVSSLVMACVMQSSYGSIGSDTAFSAISGMIIYWFQYVFIFWYNKEIFSFLTKEEIVKVLQAEMWALLVLSYIQLAAMNIGAVGSIYDKLDIFSVFVDKRIMTKVSLTGTEGASAGGIISILVMPFLLSCILNRKQHKKEIIQILLWIPPLYNTNSSTAYMTTAAVFVIFIFVGGKRGIISRNALLILCGVAGVLLVIYLNGDTILSLMPEDMSEQIRYLLFEKATDHDNGSTVSRTIPLITNWGAFTEYPFLGVGNGCQGYFYRKYFPSWAMNVAGSDVMVFYERAGQGIANGAVFFPSVLSGYGIAGTLFLVIYLFKSHRLLKSKKGKLGMFVDFYWLALIPIFMNGFQGEFAGEYYIFFLLSIPYMVPDRSEEGELELEGVYSE